MERSHNTRGPAAVLDILPFCNWIPVQLCTNEQWRQSPIGLSTWGVCRGIGWWQLGVPIWMPVALDRRRIFRTGMPRYHPIHTSMYPYWGPPWMGISAFLLMPLLWVDDGVPLWEWDRSWHPDREWKGPLWLSGRTDKIHTHKVRSASLDVDTQQSKCHRELGKCQGWPSGGPWSWFLWWRDCREVWRVCTSCHRRSGA